jgi:adenine-specific DNA-methyltransferase
MPISYEKLSALLKELFQLDQADLDFGIYRIMNQRRDEINRFLDKSVGCVTDTPYLLMVVIYVT